MLTAKQARKLANDNIRWAWVKSEYFSLIESAAERSATETYISIPRNTTVFNWLKKELTKNGFKYKITKDNSLLIKW